MWIMDLENGLRIEAREYTGEIIQQVSLQNVISFIEHSKRSRDYEKYPFKSMLLAVARIALRVPANKKKNGSVR